MIKIMVNDGERECYINIDAGDEQQVIEESFRVFNALVREIALVIGRNKAEQFLKTIHNLEHGGVFGLLMGACEG